MTSSSQSETAASDGFILIAVLWMLAALTMLVSVYSAYALNSAAASHVADDRVQAEASIRSGVEMAAYRQLAGSQQSTKDFEIQVGRTSVAVRVVPETARIDLNAAPADLLAGLFAQVGVEPGRAKFLADRVVGWRTKAEANHDAEPQLYAQRRVPYSPRQAPFENVLELSLLPEMPPTVVERLLPLVTIFSGQAQVYAVNSDPAVLSALPGMTPRILTSVLQARAKHPDDTRGLLELFGPARKYVSGDASGAVRAAIEVKLDNGRRVHADVVLRLNESGDEPYDLLYWRDDFDEPTSTAARL